MGANPSLSQATDLLELVRQSRTPRRQLQRILKEKPWLITDLLIANLDEVSRDRYREVLGVKRISRLIYSLSEPYRVVVPHGPMSIETLLEAGSYDDIDPRVNGINFPNNRARDDQFYIQLARFASGTSSHLARETLSADGYEQVTLADLLAFGAAYPEVQTKLTVLAHGQRWRQPGHYVDFFTSLSYQTPSKANGMPDDEARRLRSVQVSTDGCLGDWCVYAVRRSRHGRREAA